MKFTPFKSFTFIISVILTLCFIVLAIITEYSPSQLPYLADLSVKTNVDLMFSLRGPQPVSNDVVIVAIDDKSISHLGRWPWKRRLIADGLKRIAQGKPKAITLDIVFSEKAEFDSELTTTIANINSTIPVSLGYFFYFSTADTQDLAQNWEAQFRHIFKSRITAKISTVENPPEEIPTGVGALSSHKGYADATPHHGFFDISSDRDGLIRKTHLIGKYQNILFPSLALKTASLALNRDIVTKFGKHGIEDIFFDKETLPVNKRGEFWINYAGPTKTFRHYSFLDVFGGRIPPDEFQNKIVLLGVTAKSVADVRTTPIDPSLPGIEINANIIENLIRRNYLSRPTSLIFMEILFLLIAGVIFGVLFTRLHSISLILLSFVILVLYFVGDYTLLFKNGLLANVFIPSMHLFSIFVVSLAYKYFIEERKARRIKSAFQHYVAPSVVNQMIKDPGQLKLGGEKKELTVLFSDIRNFTQTSENMDPAKLTRLLNIYLSMMTKTVFKHFGMLDKYVGDEIMAVFGAPLATQTHPLDACRCALAMIEQLGSIRQKWAQEGISELNIGIGIHTGDMIVGNMGSDRVFDYTVIGSSVNLGSRLQNINKIYGTQLIISEDVFNKIDSQLPTRELDYIRVRGQEKPVRIYEILSQTDDHIMGEYKKGLELYRNRQWQEAIHIFQSVADKDPASKTLLERCKIYLQNPPAEDWDKVFSISAD